MNLPPGLSNLTLYFFFSDSHPATVLGIKHEGRLVKDVTQGMECGVLLDETIFYAESGGQVADIGAISNVKVTEYVARLRILDIHGAKTHENQTPRMFASITLLLDHLSKIRGTFF